MKKRGGRVRATKKKGKKIKGKKGKKPALGGRGAKEKDRSAGTLRGKKKGGLFECSLGGKPRGRRETGAYVDEKG